MWLLFLELLGDLLRSKFKESDGIDNIVVVDNVF